MNWISLELQQERFNDLRREAEQTKLVRSVEKNQPVNPVVGAAMVAIGRQFVKLGTTLQNHYAQEEVALLVPAE